MEHACEYWLALGEDRAKADAFMTEAKEASDAVMAAVREVGGDGYVTRGGLCSGVTFSGGKRPEGWKEVTAMTIGNAWRRLYFPKASTKELKAIAAKLQATRIKGGHDLGRLMGSRSVMKAGEGGSMTIMSIGAERIGGHIVLSVPTTEPGKTSAFVSDVSRKLRMSEYWLLREADAARDVVAETLANTILPRRDWPVAKLALWHVVTGEKLNDGHYINAYELTDKLYDALSAAQS